MKNYLRRLLLTFLFLSVPVFSFADFSSRTNSTAPIEFLKQLVSVSSGSGNTKGVSKVQKIAAAELVKIGFTIEEFPSTNTSVIAKQIVATRLSTQPATAQKFITFVAHADTVFEQLNPFEITADGKYLRGSGVGDDKGGLVVGLRALENYLSQNKAVKYSLRFVISPTEEVGSMGFREKLAAFAKDSVLILGLEPGRADGSIVQGRKGVRWYHIKVQGLEAHAGVSPETGINACSQLAIFIQKLTQMNDFKSGNTLSVGHIEGGKDKFNIVCGAAEAKVDVRFINEASGIKIHNQILMLLKSINIKSEKTKVKATTTYELVTQVPSFPALQTSQKALEQYKKLIFQVEGRKVTSFLSGGAADLNYMSDTSAVMLDGIGPFGDGYHTADEAIDLSSVASRTEVLVRFLNSFQAE